jgi:branched-chain amino acid transport system ATP-binding protein
MTEPILAVERIRAGYGEAVVLEDLSFHVNSGEVVCLLGANGAGKTTTMSVLSGLLDPTAGAVRFEGRNLLSMAAHLRVAAGLALCPEGRQVFPNLSVAENLILGSYNLNARKRRVERLAWVYDLYPRLREREKQKAGLLSGGEQQMLALGRALMSGPRLLMLDEPSLGLSPRILLSVLKTIGEISKAGISILLVEQNTRAALSVADRGYVLAEGRITASDSAENLANSSIVFEAFIGKSERGVGSVEYDSHA